MNIDLFQNNTRRNICVVRLKTDTWSTGKGIFEKKSITYLKRKSSPYILIEDDCMNCGADAVFNKITNIDQCKDGVYQVVTCNWFTDWETGMCEDYDYKLIPYVEE